MIHVSIEDNLMKSVEAFRARGVAVEYTFKDNGDQDFINEENRLHFYRAMEKFLSQCLKYKTGK